MTSIADERERVELGSSEEERVEPVEWELVQRIDKFVREQMPAVQSGLRLTTQNRINKLLQQFEQAPEDKDLFTLVEIREEVPRIINLSERGLIQRIELRFGKLSQQMTARIWDIQDELKVSFLEAIFPVEYAEYCANDERCFKMLPADAWNRYVDDRYNLWWSAVYLDEIVQMQQLYLPFCDVNVLRAPPPFPCVKWWRHTEAGKKLNWDKRGNSVRLVQVLTHQNLKKRVAAGALQNSEDFSDRPQTRYLLKVIKERQDQAEQFSRLSELKAGQMGKIMNPHKEEWQTPEKECHVTGRRVTGVKRLRWEADPLEGPEAKRRRGGNTGGVWVIDDNYDLVDELMDFFEDLLLEA